MLRHVAAVAALGLAAAALPPAGTTVTFEPAPRPSVTLRHCDYVATVDANDGTEDFQFTLQPARNGDSSGVSFSSANFPDHWLSPIKGSSNNAVGINTNPNNDDATWTVTGSDGNYTLVSQTRTAGLVGAVLSLARTNTGPCHDGPDVVLAAPGAGGIDAQTWDVGAPPPPPPPPPTTVSVAAGTVTHTLSQSILGCHSDEGFMHNPQAFLSNLVYGEAFETTNGLKSGWGVYLDGSATGSGQLDPGTPFSVAKRPSMHVSFTGGAGAVRLAHRGMGNEGLAFNGSQPYEGYIFARANAPTTVTVALREISSGTTLASAPLAVPGGGAWTQLSFTLTPSSSTTCVDGSGDPTVDCNSGGFPDYQCIKCGGELSFALTAPGDVWVGYARLDVGPWGRVPGVPLRADAFATLKSMGVTVVRYGGSVGSSVNWKDFRGPVYNRTGLGRTWASCDLSGWGPFDAMNAFEAMGINVAVTMADTQSVQDWADLVEYSVGDASTTWGALRIADGHPGRYEPLAWELGNEQYNNNFVQQVAAMEARAKALNYQPAWYYMFPDNGGLNAQDQAAAVAAGLPIERIATDVHVGSAGGVQEIASNFQKSPSFPASAINGEVNAIYGDGVNTASALGRAISEAMDINDWFNADAAVVSRIIGRTASFCFERNGHDDGSQWHQGLTFFQPNGTWLGPAGQYHAVLASTWAPGALAVTVGGPDVSASAQKAADGSRVVVRLANKNASPAVVELSVTGFASSTDVLVTTLAGTALTQTNPPWDKLAISPVVTHMTLPSGGGNVTLPPFSAVALELTAA